MIAVEGVQYRGLGQTDYARLEREGNVAALGAFALLGLFGLFLLQSSKSYRKK